MSKVKDEIRIEYVSFEEISKWPRNPKDHDLHELRKSFNRWGFIKPVLIDEGTKLLVAGHGRIEALGILKAGEHDPPKGVKVENGTWKVPVLRGVKFADQNEAEAFLLADNRLGEIGGWDQDLLTEMLGELVDVDNALDGMGYDIVDVMEMMGEPLEGEEGTSPSLGEDSTKEFLVIVSCESKDAQKEMYKELQGKGIEVRLKTRNKYV